MKLIILIRKKTVRITENAYLVIMINYENAHGSNFFISMKFINLSVHQVLLIGIPFS